ncbi:MAG TPA: purine-nucleoside phosphorylase [Candidatus Didemnitutus sp.]|nr:purine-nucleoside phosphorylase [Candidatus Didemnitutus sp.]
MTAFLAPTVIALCIFAHMDLSQKIAESVNSIRTVTSAQPSIGVILGTGLGGLVSKVDVQTSIEYDNIPYFPISTVESHHGRLVFGTLHGVNIVVMHGRSHVYEGYTIQQITFPVRVMNALGVRTLIVSNACGGMNPLYRRGDIMLIDDHINLLGDNPLIGPNDDRLGPRFPDMSEPYSQRLLALAEQAALARKTKVHRGVYVAVTGPNLETRAEYRFLRTIGADVVGMSTVPENIVARHMGMEVLGLSVVTDECFPDSLEAVKLEHVLAAAAQAEPIMTDLITDVISKCA